MNAFQQGYARYYDLLYSDKDYCGESAYVSRLIRSVCKKAGSILELGCGTGRHALELASLGYKVHGIDQSENMVEYAMQRAVQAPKQQSSKISFEVGNITNFRRREQFDAVVSLFHVISYQTTNDTVIDTFTTAAEHMPSGGVLVFDVWYGPAVLTQVPAVRVKRLADSQGSITRIAEPILNTSQNTVEVRYSIHFVSKDSHQHQEFKETHIIRYFFLPELELLLERAGFALQKAEEWMTGAIPSPGTWGVTVIARKC